MEIDLTAITLVGWGDVQRSPYIRLQDKAKVGRHHTDAIVCCAVQQDRAPDYLRVAAEPSLPQVLADDDDAPRAGAIFFGHKSAATLRRHAERLKKIGRDLKPLQSFRLSVAGQIGRPC